MKNWLKKTKDLLGQRYHIMRLYNKYKPYKRVSIRASINRRPQGLSVALIIIRYPSMGSASLGDDPSNATQQAYVV